MQQECFVIWHGIIHINDVRIEFKLESLRQNVQLQSQRQVLNLLHTQFRECSVKTRHLLTSLIQLMHDIVFFSFFYGTNNLGHTDVGPARRRGHGYGSTAKNGLEARRGVRKEQGRYPGAFAIGNKVG